MKNLWLIVTLALGAVTAPAWAVNKCTLPNGKTVFQDAPCAGAGEKLNIRPASGAGQPVPLAQPQTAADGSDTATAQTAPQTEAERLKAQVEMMRKKRESDSLRDYQIPKQRRAIADHTTACRNEQAALRGQKRYANNNLAGATWEGAISEEMVSVTQRCDMEARQLENDLKRLEQELADLQK